MNLMNWLFDLLKGGKNVKTTDAPFWRHRGTHMRKSRLPFHGRRRVIAVVDNWEREKFFDSIERNQRFSEIKARHSGAVKYSSVEGDRSVWFVAWPIREAQ